MLQKMGYDTGVDLDQLLAIARGLPEIVEHDKSGLLAPPGDVGSLARHTIRLLENPAEAMELGRQARRYVADEFDLSTVTAKHEQLYAELLRRKLG